MKKFIKVLIPTFIIYVLIFNNFEITNKLYARTLIEDTDRDEQRGEWVSLNNTYFVRRLATFYFYHEQRIETLLLSGAGLPSQIYCKIQIENRTVLSWPNFFMIVHTDEHPYRLYAMRCNFSNVDVSPNDKIKLTIVDGATKRELNEPFKVRINAKALKPDVVKTKGKFLLCSKYFSLRTAEQYDDLKAWFDINIKIGFEKIVIFNTSILNDAKFVSLFEVYKDTVEVRSYTEFPFISSAHEAASFRESKDNQMTMLDSKIEALHEQAAINECYMAYRTYYNFIGQFDIDELIVPKMSFNKVKQLNESLQCGSNVEGKSDLEVYFDNLYKIDKYKDAVSLWFNYVDVDYNETLIEIIQQLKSVVPTLDPNQPYGQIRMQLRSYYNEILGADVKYEIRTKAEYDYAKYLIDLYDQLNSTYANFNIMDNKFSTNLVLFNLTDFYFYSGKSIHNTQTVKYIVVHYAYFDPFLSVDLQHGYATHFRTKLKHLYLLKKSNSIENVYIDHNQYECYTRKITHNN